MSNTTKRSAHYIDSTFGQIHYYQQGDTGNNVPLVCFHMSPYSGRYYEKFQNVMSADRLVICPDTPGYGGSCAPDVPSSIEEIVQAMLKIIDEIEAPAVDLLGFHTGVFIAVEIAILRRQKVRKLILPGVPYMPIEQRSPIRSNYETPRPYFEDPDYLPGIWKEAVTNSKEDWDDDRKIEMFGEMLRSGLKINWGYLAVFEYEVERKLGLIKQPVLLPIPNEMLAEHTRSSAALFSDATVVEFPNSTADIFEKCPDEFISVVRDFLGVEE